MISDACGYTFDPCSYSDPDLVSVKFKCKQMLTCSDTLARVKNQLLLQRRNEWNSADKEPKLVGEN